MLSFIKSKRCGQVKFLSMKQKGFTLFELLIVIVVIAVLSSMLMIAGGEAQSAVKATKIVNGLTDLKMAILTWYKDNKDNVHVVNNEGKIGSTKIEAEKYFTDSVLKKYIDGTGLKIAEKEGCYSVVSNYPPVWYVCYQLENNSEKTDIIEKLTDKAKLSGQLLRKNSSNQFVTYDQGDKIYMRVLTFFND